MRTRLTITAPRVALLLVLMLPGAAAAQQTTGSVSGAVFDQTGAVLQGATVRISGENLPGGRTTTTSDAGLYNFPLLAPGRYTVEAEKEGLGKASRPVEVQLGKDTQVDVTIGVSGVQEQVTVTAATPAVDVKSTEVAFNYKAEDIQTLPLARTYTGLFQLIPGVAENNSFAPSGGASRQDNKYLMDGVDITNPGFGYLSTEVNDLDIAEFNVKRGGITAEFGRAQGFVTNAVSKSGTNQLRGSAKFEMRPSAFNADSNTITSAGEIVKSPSTTDRYLGAFNLGGPLLRDRIFWYASGQYLRNKTTDRTNALGPVPDSTDTSKEVFGKLTGQPGGNMYLNAGYRYRPRTCELCGIGNQDSADVARDTEYDNSVATVTWNWFPANRTVLDARFIHMEENSTSLPVRDLGFQPPFNPNDLPNMGQYTDTSGTINVVRGAHNLRLERIDYKRDEFRATLTQFFDSPGMAHQLKAGFGLEEGSEILERKSNGWGLLSIVGAGGTQVLATYYPEQGAQVSPGRTYSLFIQDDISFGSRLVVNAGVLLNQDEFSQEIGGTKNTFLTFGFGDEIQPRIGANYQLRQGKGDKIYGNFGRYYAMDQKSSARSLAPSRLFLQDTTFNRATGAIVSDVPRASTTGKLINPGLKPTCADEWLVGYATPFMTNWSVDVFFVRRETSDFIEDIPSALPATGPFRAAQLDSAERKYRSFTIEVIRPLMNNWSLSASYAWSRLEGNFDLDYSTVAVFNTSSAIQDGPGEFVEDRFRYGPLSQDRPHVFKLFASYMPPVLPNLTLGGYLRSQSGTPWAARGVDWDNGFRRYLEQAGSRRNDAWTNFDFLASYRVPIGGSAGLKLEGRVLNLFNNLTALSVNDRQYRDPRVRPASLTPLILNTCGTDYACATELFSAVQTTNQPNAQFGQANDWAPPRRFLLTLQVDF